MALLCGACATSPGDRGESPLVYTATGVAVLAAPESGGSVGVDDFVEASGHGLPAPDADGEFDRRRTALEAARASAMAELVEKIEGVRVSRTVSVRNMRYAGGKTDISVAGTLTGVRVVKSQYDEKAGTAAVTLRVGLDSEGKPVPERLLPAPLPSLSLRRAQAEEAARYEAMAKLREELGGAYVAQETTVKDLTLKHHSARLEVEGLVAGGVEFSDPVWVSDERCQVKARLEVDPEAMGRLRAVAQSMP